MKNYKKDNNNHNSNYKGQDNGVYEILHLGLILIGRPKDGYGIG